MRLPRRRRVAAAAAAAATTPDALPPAPVDPALATAYWSRRPVAVASRAAEVAAAFALWLGGCAARRATARLSPSSPSKRKAAAAALDAADARALRLTIARLGPAYVKICQALAARPDLLPPAYVKEFELLQDRLPPFSSEEAMALLREELAPLLGRGGPPSPSLPSLSAIFGSISREPVAAASLGQVYRATLRLDVAQRAGFVRWPPPGEEDERGGEGEGAGGRGARAKAAAVADASYAAEPLDLERSRADVSSSNAMFVPVAIKVQRPDVAGSVSLDCLLLRRAAAVARRLGRLNTNLPALVDTWSRSLARELDYRREGASAWRLGAGLREVMGASVRVPRAFGGGLTTERVLVMEWLEGTRLRSAGGARGGEGAMEEERWSSSSGGGRRNNSGGGGSGNGNGSSRRGSSSSSSSKEEDLRLVSIGVRCFLEQILGDVGYYHADPHAGNLLVLRSTAAAAAAAAATAATATAATAAAPNPSPPPPPLRLGLLDAGMCAEVSRTQRVALLRAALHLAAGKYDALARDLVALDMLPAASSAADDAPTAAGAAGGAPSTSSSSSFLGEERQQRAVVAALEDVFRAQLKQPTPFASSSFAPSSAAAPSPAALLSSDDEGGGGSSAAAAGEAQGPTFGGLGARLGRTMYRFRFRLPETFTLLIRALSVLEGLALSADPNYRVVASAFPWVARRVLLERSPELQEALRALLYSPSPRPPPSSPLRSGDGADNGDQDDEPLFDFGRLEALLREAARVPGGANPARGGSGGGGSGSGGGGTDGGDEEESALALLLSPDAEFVRGLLEDELAKGLDAAWRLGADRALGALLPALPLPLPALAAAAAPPPNRPLQQQRQRQPRRPRRLATARDEAQLEGLSRLAAAVGRLVAASASSAPPSSSSRASPSPCPTATARAQQAAQALEWLAREARRLPPEARREAAALPLRVAAKLSSRVAARAIRAALL
jgi:predicted unusual protein kinase regulating ubiquinone biosynthesis (AarF/ABC1/UbiB family)